MLGELSETQIEALLREEVIGRLGCHDGRRCYVVPVTYAYDGTCVYAHSGEGLKLRMMRAEPQVCFEVERVENLSRWQSVIAWGHFEELEGEAAAAGMQVLLDRLRPLMGHPDAQPTHGMSGSAHPGMSGHAVIYRIHLFEKTGRYEAR